MVDIRRKYQIDSTTYPIDGIYNFDAKVFLSVDGGENYYYCGIGRFCKTLHEAEEWCKRYEADHADQDLSTVLMGSSVKAHARAERHYFGKGNLL